MTHSWKAFLFASFLLATPAWGNPPLTIELPNNSEVCVDDVTNLGHLNFFTWSAKQILDALAQGEFLREREWKTIEDHPQLALYIKDAADLGIDLSEELCPMDPGGGSGIYGSDDEVDALRHFIMSAYLAWRVGPDPARSFMAAHEDALFENSNMMDYYNNDLGFRFGTEFRNRPLIQRTSGNFRRRLTEEIQRKFSLHRGHREDFLVLATGPSRCAQRKYPNF